MSTKRETKMRTSKPHVGAAAKLATWSRPGVALATIALGGLAATAGCNVILGIDGDAYRDVAVEMCKCEGIEYGIADCQTRVRDSLANADPDVRESWLGDFDTRDCDVCGSPDIYTCLQRPPVCRGLAERCEGALACCGVLDEKSACIDGRCSACIPTNDPAAPGCTTNTDCCGGLREGEVYCYEGRCVEQASACKHSFDVCSGSSECCGAEALAAGLTPLGACGKKEEHPGPERCFETCAPGGVNCPGCCARLEDTPSAIGFYACLDGPTTAAALEPLIPPGSTLCDSLCELGVDEDCPPGSSCTVLSLDVGVGLHLCQVP